VSNSEGQNSLVKAVKDKGQYVLAFGVIASLLVVANIPIFVVFFFGIFVYFVAKMVSTSGKHRTRGIFEFYLSAHEILRDDMRSWYGFEINETIERGENIVSTMKRAPTLVHFALGSLYNKVGDHSSALKHLAYVAENPESFEASVVYPSAELRNYVNVLRKIERDPASAPLTSAAVRSLERGRRMKTQGLLEQSRIAVETTKPKAELVKGEEEGTVEVMTVQSNFSSRSVVDVSNSETNGSNNGRSADGDEKRTDEPGRKPITELLHDIYDRSPQ
jgi:hypothetical protein